MKKKILLVIAIVGLVGAGILYITIQKTANNKSQVVLSKPIKSIINKPIKSNKAKSLYPLKIYDEIINNPSAEKEIPEGTITEADIYFKDLNPKYNFIESKEIIKKILGNPNKVEEEKLFDTIFLTERVENSIEYEKDPENVIMRTYYYPDFEVRVFVLDDVESIHSITLTGSSVNTVRGIAVGDSNEKVVEKYGQGEYSVAVNESYHFYNLKVDNERFRDHAIKIHLVDDIVSDISIY
jgi:hypothetical protein